MVPPCSMSAFTLKRQRQRLFWHSNSFSASSILIYGKERPPKLRILFEGPFR